MPSKKDEFTLLEDISEGFADIVDGSIFDFGDTDVTPEVTDNGKRGNDAGATASGASEVSNGKPAKRATAPGIVEGVTTTGTPAKKGKAAGSEKPGESSGSDGTGADDSAEKPADKPK